MKDKYKTSIDLKTAYCCDKLYSRLVWQKLFDVYRSNNGDLTYMDNMLCDLYTLKRKIAEGSFVSYWFHSDRGYTTMADFADPAETCYRIEFIADDMVVLITEE
jgi:hypothetical protein